MLIEHPDFIDGVIVFVVITMVLVSMVLAVRLWLRRKCRVNPAPRHEGQDFLREIIIQRLVIDGEVL